MWKKNELGDESPPENRPRVEPVPAPRPASQRMPVATIGPSITIKGDIIGEEDLLIEGRVEGAIQLRQHNVTVGSSGRVIADIHGKQICIDGEVTGDLVGDEVLIRQSGRVEGNAKAPRVMLENGCHFRGSIDMKPAKTDAQLSPVSPASPGPSTNSTPTSSRMVPIAK